MKIKLTDCFKKIFLNLIYFLKLTHKTFSLLTALRLLFSVATFNTWLIRM
ncbi:Uncharacterised protein [Legionella oakridgensis]|nr:Uncharacterised protein [Legionella oakridgensis]